MSEQEQEKETELQEHDYKTVQIKTADGLEFDGAEEVHTLEEFEQLGLFMFPASYGKIVRQTGVNDKGEKRVDKTWIVNGVPSFRAPYPAKGSKEHTTEVFRARYNCYKDEVGIAKMLPGRRLEQEWKKWRGYGDDRAFGIFTGKKNDLMVLDIDDKKVYWDKVKRIIAKEYPDYPHIWESAGNKVGGQIYFRYPREEDGLNPNIYNKKEVATGFEIFLDTGRHTYAPCAGNRLKHRPKNWKPSPILYAPKALIDYLNTTYSNRLDNDEDEEEHLALTTKGTLQAEGLTHTYFPSHTELLVIFEDFKNYLIALNSIGATSEEEKDKAKTDAAVAFAEYTSGAVAKERRISGHDVDLFWSRHPHLHKLTVHTIRKNGQDIKTKGTKSPQHWASEKEKAREGVTIPGYKDRMDFVTLLLMGDATVDKDMLFKAVHLINNFGYDPIPPETVHATLLKQVEDGKNHYNPEWKKVQKATRYDPATNTRTSVYRDVVVWVDKKTRPGFFIVNETKETILDYARFSQLDEQLGNFSQDETYRLAKHGDKAEKNMSIAHSARPMVEVNDLYKPFGITYPAGKESAENPIQINTATRRPLLEIIRHGQDALPPDHEFKNKEVDPEKDHPAIDAFMRHLHLNTPEYQRAYEWVDTFLPIKLGTGEYTPIGLFYVGVSDAGKNFFQDIILKNILGLQRLEDVANLKAGNRLARNPPAIKTVTGRNFVKEKQTWADASIVRIDELVEKDREVTIAMVYERFKEVSGWLTMDQRDLYKSPIDVDNHILFMLTANSGLDFPIDRTDRRLVVFEPNKTIGAAARNFYLNRDEPVLLGEEFERDRPEDESPIERIGAEEGEYIELLKEDMLNQLTAKCLSWHKVYKDYVVHGKRPINIKRPPMTPKKADMQKNVTKQAQIGSLLCEPAEKAAAQLLKKYMSLDYNTVCDICAVACLPHTVECADGTETDTGDWVILRHAGNLARALKKQSDVLDKDYGSQSNHNAKIGVMDMVKHWKDKIQFTVPENEYAEVLVYADHAPVTVERFRVPGLADALRTHWKTKNKTDELPKFLSEDPEVIRQYLVNQDRLEAQEKRMLQDNKPWPEQERGAKAGVLRTLTDDELLDL